MTDMVSKEDRARLMLWFESVSFVQDVDPATPVRYADDDPLEYVAPDKDSVVKATKKGTLDWSPKKNWVDHAGGLPKYVEEIALALIRDHGMPRERAIPVAINRVKLWAGGGGGVKADTRVKAAKSLAQWEAMKAKARAKKD